MKIRSSTIFALAIGLVMAWAVFVAKDFRPFVLVGIYPVIAGSFTLGAVLWLLINEIRGAGGGKKPRGVAVDLVADDMPASVRARKAARAFGWFLALLAAIYLLGFKIGAIAFFIAYVGMETRTRWFLIVGLAGGVVFVLVLFQRFLEVFWPLGLLGEWLGEYCPWWLF